MTMGRSAGNKPKRIICVGNRYVPGDDTGPKVYDFLLGVSLPPDVELIDGGLMGLDLLRFLEGAERVVFVDSVSGFSRPGEIVTLDEAGLVVKGTAADYGHSGGFGYLFRVLPEVFEGRIPAMTLVGLERPKASVGKPDETEDEIVESIARQVLRIIDKGTRRRKGRHHLASISNQ